MEIFLSILHPWWNGFGGAQWRFPYCCFLIGTFDVFQQKIFIRRQVVPNHVNANTRHWVVNLTFHLLLALVKLFSAYKIFFKFLKSFDSLGIFWQKLTSGHYTTFIKQTVASFYILSTCIMFLTRKLYFALFTSLKILWAHDSAQNGMRSTSSKQVA